MSTSRSSIDAICSTSTVSSSRKRARKRPFTRNEGKPYEVPSTTLSKPRRNWRASLTRTAIELARSQRQGDDLVRILGNQIELVEDPVDADSRAERCVDGEFWRADEVVHGTAGGNESRHRDHGNREAAGAPHHADQERRVVEIHPHLRYAQRGFRPVRWLTHCATRWRRRTVASKQRVADRRASASARA